MHNDNMFEVPENTLIPKPLMASKKSRDRFYIFLRNLGFCFLKVTETALKYLLIK